MILYGIREEFTIEYGKEIFDEIFLLIDNKNLYEYSQRKQTLRKVNTFISPNYKTKKRNIKIDINLLKTKTPFKNEALAFKTKMTGNYISKLNEDIFINLEMFENQQEKSKRFLENRPVWIFKGNSLLGKSYIASFINPYKEIFETDSTNKLPDIIFADIIVLGNKYNYSIEEIKDKIPKDSKIIEVDFSDNN